MTTNLLADTEEGTKAENQPKKVSSKQLFFWRYLDQAKKNVYLLVVIEALGKGGTGVPLSFGFLVSAVVLSWFSQQFKFSQSSYSLSTTKNCVRGWRN